MQNKAFQYFEFTRRQVYRSSLSHGPILLKVEFNISKPVPLQRSYSISGTPQMCPNASQELLDAEWLGHIIIGPDFQPNNLIGLLAARCQHDWGNVWRAGAADPRTRSDAAKAAKSRNTQRSEEHTSELQSHSDLVCRLLLEKKKDQ